MFGSWLNPSSTVTYLKFLKGEKQQSKQSFLQNRMKNVLYANLKYLKNIWIWERSKKSERNQILQLSNCFSSNNLEITWKSTTRLRSTSPYPPLREITKMDWNFRWQKSVSVAAFLDLDHSLYNTWIYLTERKRGWQKSYQMFRNLLVFASYRSKKAWVVYDASR